MIEWEGAEICFYINGESHAIDLSEIQFLTVAKILGLEIGENTISYFSDSTLKKFFDMDSNPLKFKKKGEKKE